MSLYENSAAQVRVTVPLTGLGPPHDQMRLRPPFAFHADRCVAGRSADRAGGDSASEDTRFGLDLESWCRSRRCVNASPWQSSLCFGVSLLASP